MGFGVSTRRPAWASGRDRVSRGEAHQIRIAAPTAARAGRAQGRKSAGTARRLARADVTVTVTADLVLDGRTVLTRLRVSVHISGSSPLPSVTGEFRVPPRRSPPAAGRYTLRRADGYECRVLVTGVGDGPVVHFQQETPFARPTG